LSYGNIVLAMSTAEVFLTSREESRVATLLNRISDSQEAHRNLGRRWAILAWWLDFLSLVLSLASGALVLLDILGFKHEYEQLMLLTSLSMIALNIIIRTGRTLLRAEGKAALRRVTTRILARLWHRIQADTGSTLAQLEMETEKSLHEVSELADPALEIVIIHQTDELP
jgi:hypothetical protein